MSTEKIYPLSAVFAENNQLLVPENFVVSFFSCFKEFVHSTAAGGFLLSMFSRFI